VNFRLFMTHLQYVDDTLFKWKEMVKNLWAIKTILVYFELASSFRVNFSKSGIMGINVDVPFLNLAANFFNCSIGSIPFKYPDLPIEANSRKISTWKPLLNTLVTLPSSLSTKLVSLGGSFVLLNLVLNSFPVAFLFCMKIPIDVWRQIMNIQRCFLWGGYREARKIPWVRWPYVCKPKSEGWLCKRDLSLIKLVVLGNWCWRLMTGGEAYWEDIIRIRYAEGS